MRHGRRWMSVSLVAIPTGAALLSCVGDRVTPIWETGWAPETGWESAETTRQVTT